MRKLFLGGMIREQCRRQLLFLPVIFALGYCLTVSASQLSIGNKSLLFIRLGFEDIKGEPISEARALQVMRTVADYYKAVSDGKLVIETTFTPMIRMPHTAKWYATNHPQRDKDAHAGAKALGFDPDKFDLEIMVFDSAIGGDGNGIFRGKGVYLAPPIGFSGVVHELGHNFGLPHSAVWKAWDGSVAGPGTAMTYADGYDPMGGSGDDSRAHFSVRSKQLLGWFDSRDVENVSTSGRYRIYAQDLPGAPGPRGLRIAVDGTNEYWVEFRQLITDNPYMMNGVRILKCYADPSGRVDMTLSLLDMTPDSPLGSKDAPLLFGRTFSDDRAGIYITPLGKGNTTPESVDVQVNFGHLAGNRSPNLLVTARPESSTGAGEPIVFRASGSNFEQGPLEYSWDFGDGSFDWGKAIVAHRYNAPGNFVVRCSVTDMKGGSADKLVPMTVGYSPSGLLVGSVVSAGKPLANVLVAADATNSVRTDAEGFFALSGVQFGKHRITARVAGYWIDSETVYCPASDRIRMTGFPLGRDDITSENGFVLKDDDRLTTPAKFRPPVDITIVAKTSATNLRIGYAADQVIFNWEVDKSELRVDGGPANGKHTKGMGAIPPGQYVTIRWNVTPKRQTLYVDGKLRFEHYGDYSQIDRPVSIFTHQSTVTVKTFKVTQVGAF